MACPMKTDYLNSSRDSKKKSVFSECFLRGQYTNITMEDQKSQEGKPSPNLGGLDKTL